MEVCMAGMDNRLAPVEMREQFTFSREECVEGMRRACAECGTAGCVIVSTCNRTELWFSGESSGTPLEALCGLKHVPADNWRPYFTLREGHQAVTHLFETACGMKSQIFGEDQILTQVGAALDLAREAGTADSVLEHLFRSAVTAAKKVKTTVRFHTGSRSAAQRMVSFLEERMGGLAGRPCLVIGNGEMGKLAAMELVERGCRVSMTVRHYRHGEVTLPEGVTAIPYEDRYGYLSKVEAVVSATSSPHYTMKAGDLRPLPHPILFCDLAVPRDVDPEISHLPGATVCDMDDLGTVRDMDASGVRQAQTLLEDAVRDFEAWDGFRPFVGGVQRIGEWTAKDMRTRMERRVKALNLPGGAGGELLSQMEDATEKAVCKLLFGLREHLDPALWPDCLTALRQSAGIAGQESSIPRKPDAPSGRPPRFPLFADLSRTRAAVFGGGSVAARRIKVLSAFCKSITVIAPEVRPEIGDLPNVEILRRAYQPGDCEGYGLILAATNSREVNRQIHKEAVQLGQLVNVSDCPDECGFYFPAVIRHGPIVAGVVSDSGNHALVKRTAAFIRKALEGEDVL